MNGQPRVPILDSERPSVFQRAVDSGHGRSCDGGGMAYPYGGHPHVVDIAISPSKSIREKLKALAGDAIKSANE